MLSIYATHLRIPHNQVGLMWAVQMFRWRRWKSRREANSSSPLRWPYWPVQYLFSRNNDESTLSLRICQRKGNFLRWLEARYVQLFVISAVDGNTPRLRSVLRYEWQISRMLPNQHWGWLCTYQPALFLCFSPIGVVKRPCSALWYYLVIVLAQCRGQ